MRGGRFVRRAAIEKSRRVDYELAAAPLAAKIIGLPGVVGTVRRRRGIDDHPADGVFDPTLRRGSL